MADEYLMEALENRVRLLEILDRETYVVKARHDALLLPGWTVKALE